MADTVGRTVALDSAEVLSSARRVILGVEVLDDVVLNERVLEPSVDSEVAVSIGRVGTRVGNGPELMQSANAEPLTNSDRCSSTYLSALPGFQPLPPTKLPPDCQLTL